MQRANFLSAAEMLSKLPAGRYFGLGQTLLLLTFYNGPAELFKPKWLLNLRRLAAIGDYTRPICLVGRMERSSICLVPRYETPNSRASASETEVFANELAAALETLGSDPETSKRSAPQIIVGSPVEAMYLVKILNQHLAPELLEGVTVNWHSCVEPTSVLTTPKVSVSLPEAPGLAEKPQVGSLVSA